MSAPPRYRIPPNVFWPLALAWIMLRPRRFHADAAACIATLSPAPRILGREHIPAAGPALVVFNHYTRPGFSIWWLAMAIAAQLPEQAHLIMAGELTTWHPPLGPALTRFALARLACLYGFTVMPPMPPRPQDVAARALAVRRVLRYLEKTSNPLVMLAPEGRDNPADSRELGWPPPGAGRFIGMLAEKGLRIIPAGGWEQGDGQLCVRFGPSFGLADLPRLTASDFDQEISASVMRAIAELLPEPLRGPFQVSKNV